MLVGLNAYLDTGEALENMMIRLASGVCMFWFMAAIASAAGIEQTTPDERVFESLRSVSPESEIAEIRYHDGIAMFYFQTDTGVDGYISPDGQYIMPSRLLKVEENGLLQDDTKSRVLQDILDLESENFLVFQNPSIEQKGSVIVFGDVTCEYCSLFHNRIKQINDAGISVKYLLYPRAGINSTSALLMSEVMCSESPHNSFDKAIKALGVSVELKGVRQPCDSSLVEQAYLKGKALDIKGTPAFIFEDGVVRNAYMMPEDVIDYALSKRAKVAQ